MRNIAAVSGVTLLYSRDNVFDHLEQYTHESKHMFDEFQLRKKMDVRKIYFLFLCVILNSSTPLPGLRFHVAMQYSVEESMTFVV